MQTGKQSSTFRGIAKGFIWVATCSVLQVNNIAKSINNQLPLSCPSNFLIQEVCLQKSKLEVRVVHQRGFCFCFLFLYLDYWRLLLAYITSIMVVIWMLVKSRIVDNPVSFNQHCKMLAWWFSRQTVTYPKHDVALFLKQAGKPLLGWEPQTHLRPLSFFIFS